ncbi:MAG TPA: hypothetical protein VGQ76_13135 [Thermoanaerobaculia bacterium]|nr:hypothetical protein [Thermoanaerobaculia bacterium]
MKVTVGTHETGYIVVTDDAILSILSKSQLEAAGPVVGVIGAAVGRAQEKRKAEGVRPIALPPGLRDLQRVESCKFSDLPRTLLSANGFPRVEGFRAVTIYPKRLVQAVKASVWRGVVITIAGQAHPLSVQMWQIGKLKRHLTEAGYRLT